METLPLKFSVNGQSRTLSVDASATLLDVLREQLMLSGTKKGCDHGQCGACTVLVDGCRINACLRRRHSLRYETTLWWRDSDSNATNYRHY